MSLFKSTGDVSITNCTFQNNIIYQGNFIGVGGGVLLYALTGDVNITNCTFENNYSDTIGGNGSAGGAVMLYGVKGDFSTTSCTFKNNSALYGGAVAWVGVQGGVQNKKLKVVLYGSVGNIIITNCTFQNNSATKGGGALFLWVGVLKNVLNGQTDTELNGSTANITNCTLQNNSAILGGAILVVSTRSTLIMRSTFTNNTADGGAAIYAVNSYIPSVFVVSDFLTSDTVPFGNITLQNVIIRNNQCSCNGYNEMRGVAFYFNGMRVDIFGTTISGSQLSSNSPLGAIQGSNGFLQLHGNITFINNTGVNGGAISLSNNVPLYFYEKCSVQFFGNAAAGFGGAI